MNRHRIKMQNVLNRNRLPFGFQRNEMVRIVVFFFFLYYIIMTSSICWLYLNRNVDGACFEKRSQNQHEKHKRMRCTHEHCVCLRSEYAWKSISMSSWAHFAYLLVQTPLNSLFMRFLLLALHLVTPFNQLLLFIFCWNETNWMT